MDIQRTEGVLVTPPETFAGRQVGQVRLEFVDNRIVTLTSEHHGAWLEATWRTHVGDRDRWPLTEAQVAANAALVRSLGRAHPITHLLGHHEVMGFRAHPYFVEREPRYRNEKHDPGPAFMSWVRAQVADLGLAGPER